MLFVWRVLCHLVMLIGCTKFTISVEMHHCGNMEQSLMIQTLELGFRTIGQTKPNPNVGCLITDSSGLTIGKGWHRKAGCPHAEVVALEEAGTRAIGGTAYVSLEPCNHYGRTPPCTLALRRSGVRRVVVGMVDPDPRVSGAGARALQEAGIDVTILNGTMSRICKEINAHFVHRVKHGRPHLTAWYGYSSMLGTQGPFDQQTIRELQNVRGNVTSALAGIDTLIVSAKQLLGMSCGESLSLLALLPSHVSVLVTTLCADNGTHNIGNALDIVSNRIRLLLREEKISNNFGEGRKWFLLPFTSPGCNSTVSSAHATGVTVLPAAHVDSAHVAVLNIALDRACEYQGSNGALILSESPAYMLSMVNAHCKIGTSSGLVQRMLLSKCDECDRAAEATVHGNSESECAQHSIADATTFAQWIDWLSQRNFQSTPTPVAFNAHRCRRSFVDSKIRRYSKRCWKLPQWISALLPRGGSSNRYSRKEDSYGGIEKTWSLSAHRKCAVYRIDC